MKKVNVRDIPEEVWSSPKAKYSIADRGLSLALGRDPASPDPAQRHPFDVEICRIPPGKSACPFHSHSAQWEFYHVISGTGVVRHRDGSMPLEPGDAFIFEPGHPHQVANDGASDLVLYIVADNPIGESCHYPDSKKWLVRSPERALIRSDPLDYLDGEE
jgi:uncharacterized cupin superfamily protein